MRQEAEAEGEGRSEKLKLPERNTIEKQLDDLWRKRIKQRDGYKCMYPGCNYHGDDVEAHHIWGRGNHGSRWLMDCGITLCHSCHREAEKYPNAFRKMVEIRYLGFERMLAITQAARSVAKWTIDQLMEMKEQLKAQGV